MIHFGKKLWEQRHSWHHWHCWGTHRGMGMAKAQGGDNSQQLSCHLSPWQCLPAAEGWHHHSQGGNGNYGCFLQPISFFHPQKKGKMDSRERKKTAKERTEICRHKPKCQVLNKTLQVIQVHCSCVTNSA